MPQEDVQSTEYPFSKKQIVWGLVAVFSVYATVAFSVQTLMIARPKITADLDGLPLYAWSVSIASLVMALGTVIFSKFSDMYGRRLMLMISLIASLTGTVLSAISPNFIFFIVAGAIGVMGVGAMTPLVFAVVSDLFPPSKRGKWVGLLNIPVGFFTLIGPSLGGLLVDTLNWRYIYWMTIPLLLFCLFTVPIGVPPPLNRDSGRKIDIQGCILVALASSTTIIGFSFAGTKYPWLSTHIIGLLGFSLIIWIIFLWVESNAKEPILDPIILRNRTFSTIALATFLSSFGSMGMMMYFPMFLQGVQDISTFHSGMVTTPYGVLAAFMGVPAGYFITRFGRFKWMYVAGYGFLTMSMYMLIFFNAGTPIGWSLVVAVLGGLGYGVMPTINTIVIQNAVPQRLMGAAMGALFFFISIGMAISPAILGSTMNVSYAKALSQSIPEGLSEIADEKTLAALDDPQVLLSVSALEDLRKTFMDYGENGPQLFRQTVESIRYSLKTGLSNIFLIGAIMTLLAFLIICTIPGNSVGSEVNSR
jgi:MFS family permease